MVWESGVAHAQKWSGEAGKVKLLCTECLLYGKHWTSHFHIHFLLYPSQSYKTQAILIFILQMKRGKSACPSLPKHESSGDELVRFPSSFGA